MKQLKATQIAIVERVVDNLKALKGVEAIVLGGSHARGRARPDSDIDIGLYYTGRSPFSVDEVRAVASRLNDVPDPVVSEYREWGRWVDGGAWLTIEGQRVDLLYRSLETVKATLADAQDGRFEIDYEQQPPFGFFGPTLLGEVAIAEPLHDPQRLIDFLKAEVSPMPEALADAVIRNRLWSVEFGLSAFAGKFAANGDVHGVAGCISRFAQALVLAVFAFNRAYPLNDKTTLAEIEEFCITPHEFGYRLRSILANIGSTPEALKYSVSLIRTLFEEVRGLADHRYASLWRFPS